MRLAIVILNYRTPGLVIDALVSLEGQVEPNWGKVIVVDNNSGDDSVEKVQQAITEKNWSAWAEVLPSSVNGGFSAGNNLGINAVQADYYLLLNSDTIVRPNAIATLLEVADAHPEAGLLSPRLEWPDATPQISCFRYKSPMSELIDAAATGPVTKFLASRDVSIPVSDQPFEPEWTSFACVLVRRAVIDQIGLMDEGYFMYFDDIDYCHRARDAGWQILHWPQARVVHLRGGSGDVKSDVAARRRPRAYLYASRSRYFTKFYGYFGLWLANLMWLVGRSISLLREVTGSKQRHTCDYMAQDIWINWRSPMKMPTLPGGKPQ